MTEKTTSTDRSRRSRAAAKLGFVWVQGYVRGEDAAQVNGKIAEATLDIERSLGDDT